MSYAPFVGSLATRPFSGPRTTSGNGYGRSYSRTMTTNRKRQRRAVSFSKKVMSTLPSKQHTVDTSVNLSHNSINTLNLTQGIFQGTDNVTRIGDAINLSALKFKGVYFTASTAGAYSFRVLVGFSGEEISASVFGSGLGASQIFLPNTSGTFSSNGIVNPKAFSVLHDSTVDVGSQIAGVIDLSSLMGTISLNDQKFQYQSAASIYGKTKNLYMVVVAIVGGGTTGVTAAGSVVMSTSVYFKS